MLFLYSYSLRYSQTEKIVDRRPKIISDAYRIQSAAAHLVTPIIEGSLPEPLSNYTRKSTDGRTIIMIIFLGYQFLLSFLITA